MCGVASKFKAINIKHCFDDNAINDDDKLATLFVCIDSITATALLA